MNLKHRKVPKIFMGVLFFLCTMFTALYLGNASFASEDYIVSGYIRSGYTFSANAESEILSGFRVEIVELNNISTVTNEAGYFKLVGVPVSSTGYTLRISKPGFLQRFIKKVPVNDDLIINDVLNPIDVWPGDMARNGIQDNAINLCDIVEIASRFNSSTEDSRYNRNLDLNKDESINMVDVVIIASHFNSTSNNYPQYFIHKFPIEVLVIDNNTVEVTFNMKLDNTVSKNMFSIKDLDIIDASIKVDGNGRKVMLKTSNQTAGVKYILTYENTALQTVLQFEGTSVLDNIKPRLISVAAIDNKKVEVKFNEAVDIMMSVDISNYSIPGLLIINADLSPSGDLAILTTSSQTGGTIYKLTVSNITDKSGNIIDPDYNEFQFGGIHDKDILTSPKLRYAVSKSNTTVEAAFDEEIDISNAEDVSNYSIPGLSIVKAELSASGDSVILTTSSQTAGTIYRLTVSNITDKEGNIINPDYDESQFGGMPYNDGTQPKLEAAYSISNTKIKVIFSEEVNILNAEDVSNYSITGLTVIKAKYEPNSKSVTLTTSSQDIGTIYKLKVSNIKDKYGNYLDAAYSEKQFGGVAPDTQGPKLLSACALDSYTVRVTFSEQINEESALSCSSYNISPDLGSPISVNKVNEGPEGTVWILKTAPQKSGTIYTLTVNNVTDLEGNQINIDRNEMQFGGMDTIKPFISTAVALDRSTVRIVFSEEIRRYTLLANAFTFSLYSGNENSPASITGENVHPDSILVSDDNRSVTVNFANRYMTAGAIYNVIASESIRDMNGNSVGTDNNRASFAGLGVENTPPKISAITAINNLTIKVIFSEEITLASELCITDFNITPSLTATLNKCILSEDKTSLSLYFKEYGENPKLTSGKIYTLTLTDSGKSKIKDNFGTNAFSTNVYDSKGNFAGMSAEVSPIQFSIVMAIDNNTLDIFFNQAIEEESIKSLKNEDIIITNGGNKIPSTVALIRPEGNTQTKIRLFLNTNNYSSRLLPGNVYKLTIAPGKITNLNGLIMQKEGSTASFAAISTVNPPPKMLGVSEILGNQISVSFSERISNMQPDGSDFEITEQFGGSTDIKAIAATVDTSDNTGRTILITLSEMSTSPRMRILKVLDYHLKDEAGIDYLEMDSKAYFGY